MTHNLTTFDYKSSLLQKLMVFAYKTVEDREEMAYLSKPQFWSTLPLRIRMAVYVGNLNYQIGNGGFSQWINNGHSDCVDELLQFIDLLPTAGPNVAAIIRSVMQKISTAQETGREVEEDLDEILEAGGANFDCQYYALETSFLNEVEDILRKYSSDQEFAAWFLESILVTVNR